MKHSRRILEDLLGLADVRINGSRPWDLRVHEKGFFDRVLAYGSIGLGESYTAGWWDCDALDEFFCHVLLAELDKVVARRYQIWLGALVAQFMTRVRPGSRFAVAEQHYDLGNDLFEAMLDRSMSYSCAYWKDVTSLDAAQAAKLAMIGEKMGLDSRHHLLDIGCGWGGLAVYAAGTCGTKVTGVTISHEQAKLARQRTKDLPVQILLQDYRETCGRYDRIASIGMFEHVGPAAYRDYFLKARSLLAPGGNFVLQTIVNDRSPRVDPWLEKHIFPNSVAPSLAQIVRATEGLFSIRHLEDIGLYYDPTCMAWFSNFRAGWPKLRDKYGGPFKRKWEYYLQMAAGNFRARASRVLQIVLTPLTLSQT